jgi:hypothetical protein
MALGWAAADLLTRFNSLARRPATDAVGTPEKYSYLAQGQVDALLDIALLAPDAFFVAPVALTAAADRKTFTFPSSIRPVGPVELYPSLAAIPDSPMVEGVDFMAEGSQIRITNNRAHAGDIYARYVAMPSDIDASTEPTLAPPQARELIVFKAVALFAEAGGLRGDLADRMEQRYQQALRKWLLYFHNQYDGQGTGASAIDGGDIDPLLTSPDLGV